MLPPAQTPAQEREDKQLVLQVEAVLAEHEVNAGPALKGLREYTGRVPARQWKSAAGAPLERLGCTRTEEQGAYLLLVQRHFKQGPELVDWAPHILLLLAGLFVLNAAVGAARFVLAEEL